MSGVSGAGRNASLPLIFCEANESVRAYSVPKHRHLSEIEQELSKAAGQQVAISFTPHLGSGPQRHLLDDERPTHR